MRGNVQKLIVFNNVTLDGYFTGPHGDFSWANKDTQDAEWNAFVAGNAGGGGTLLLGRLTYEIMASYWPTPMAAKNDSVLAERMNKLSKVVFSRTMAGATGPNTKFVKDGMAG